LVWKFGLIDLWVAGYNFCENVHADRHCDPRDARLSVHLCTTDGAPADCVELNRLFISYFFSCLVHNAGKSLIVCHQRYFVVKSSSNWGGWEEYGAACVCWLPCQAWQQCTMWEHPEQHAFPPSRSIRFKCGYPRTGIYRKHAWRCVEGRKGTSPLAGLKVKDVMLMIGRTLLNRSLP